MAAPQGHLTRLKLADLVLDTLPYGAHTTASDALWAGAPVLTCLGASFAGRVASSLLAALDLPELIADSPGEYEARALQLAGDPAMLAALRAKLAAKRNSASLFDTARIARDLETAYAKMWERQQRGDPPVHFEVPALP